LRPGGRTERVRQAVAQAVLDMLKDGNVQFSMGAIAERTGVHRSTVYKRWPARADLVREALTLHNRRLEIPNTGSWRQDVHALARALAEFAWDPAEIGMNAAVAANADAAFSKWMFKSWMPVQRKLRRPIERAIARGELPKESDPDLLLTMLYSPIIVMTVFEKKRPDPAFVSQLAETLIRVATPAPPASPKRP
jgi:AcrR family transcriptional regulator